MSEKQPQEHRIAVNGTQLCYFEWGQPVADQPSWLFCHATGFHARCWDQVIAGLPADAHVIALDTRGHGRSDKVPPYDWFTFGEDVRAVVNALDLHQLIGVGHSMGGHALTSAAAHEPQRFSRLLLVDPVIFDPDVEPAESGMALADASEHPVARRKADFASWEEMYERFADRMPYAVWRRPVLADYCRFGVLPQAEGQGVTLACPPIVEASVYMGSLRSDLRPLLARVTMPVTVLRVRERDPDAQGMDFSTSPTWPALAAQLPDAADIYLPELTHLVSMQAPELVSRCAMKHVVRREELADLLAEFNT